MNWYEAEVRALEALQNERDGQCRPIVFYGSSSIRLWGTLKEDFPDLPFLNLGFGGSTMEACNHFFERIVLPFQPSALVLYAGDNDLGDGRKPEQVLRYYQCLSSKVNCYLDPIPFALISIKCSPARYHLKAAIQNTNLFLEQEHLSKPGRFFLDITSPMMNVDGTPRKELYVEDGLHLNSKGYAVWREVLTPYIPLLKQSGEHPPLPEIHEPRISQMAQSTFEPRDGASYLRK